MERHLLKLTEELLVEEQVILSLHDAILLLADAVQLAGTLVIVLSALYAILAYGKSFMMQKGKPANMQEIRIQLGRGLVLGLEFLIGADIIRTLAVPSLQEIAILGAIVLVRTILSLTIEYEIGRYREK